MDALLTRAAQDILKSTYAIALTGAGISTDSGIADFRGPKGIWTKNHDAERKAYQTYDTFLKDPGDYWEGRLTQTSPLGDLNQAEPNAGHYALAELEQMGHLKCVITQNIDGLHIKANSQCVLEYHGSIFKLRCPSCGTRFWAEEYDLIELKQTGKLPPLCRNCDMPIKSDVVHFNEGIPDDVARDSLNEAAKCDLMLICGTSAVVYPFAQLPRLARERDVITSTTTRSRVTIIEVNSDPTPLTLENVSDYLIRGNTSDILPKIVALMKP